MDSEDQKLSLVVITSPSAHDSDRGRWRRVLLHSVFLESLPRRGGCAQSQGRVLACRVPTGPSGSRPFPALQFLGLLVGVLASKHPHRSAWTSFLTPMCLGF